MLPRLHNFLVRPLAAQSFLVGGLPEGGVVSFQGDGLGGEGGCTLL